MLLKFIKSSYTKVKNALAKTRSLLGDRIRSLFSGREIDEETLEQLEQIFYEADLGVEVSLDLTQKAKELYRKDPKLTVEALLHAIEDEIVRLLNEKSAVSQEDVEKKSPQVVLIVGVNGNGKTTSVAKLAHLFQSQGQKVLLAATDTFRAAACEQLEIWANRISAELVKGAPKSDPAAVTFDALSAAKARGCEVVILDTAGRLHTRTDLMQELSKIRKVCDKVIPGSPHETFLVLDATIGQNAIDQAKIFHQTVPLTGLILTKLDGTAKGGIIVTIVRQLGVPLRFIGVGETLDDLEPFDAKGFAKALFE